MIPSFSLNRLPHGQGRTLLVHADGWDDVAQHFTAMVGTRQIIVVDIHRVQTSCGYGIPLYEYQSQRSTLPIWAEKKGPVGMAQYQIDKGSTRIDDLITPIGQTHGSGQ